MARCADVTDGQALVMWVVYDKPSDFPSSFVARKHVMEVYAHEFVATQELHVAPTLQELRAKLPAGLYPIGRSAMDAPQIVEVWI